MATIRIFKPRSYGTIKPIVGHHGQPIQAAELSTPQHGELFAHWTAEDWQRLNAAMREEAAAHRERLRLQHQPIAGARCEPRAARQEAGSEAERNEP